MDPVGAARLWLSAGRHLPWGLMHFLDDAYQRGLLRQVGAAYQFRHARLQDHLDEDPFGWRPTTSRMVAGRAEYLIGGWVRLVGT